MKLIIFALIIFISFVCVNAQTKADVDCVRGTPERIINKKYYPAATFKLTKSKENPSEQIGTEKVRLDKNTNLIIFNSGCEYFSLTFSYELSGFSHKLGDTKFWYQKAISLMTKLEKGIRSKDKWLIKKGTNGLRLYIKKTRTPKFETDIDFGFSEIREFAIVNKAKKQAGNKYQFEVSYSVGPL
jgi:hypothetical protein